MIYRKSEEEIELMRKSNLLVSRTLAMLANEIREGVSTLFLDKLAEEFIRANGGVPGFLNYNGFPNSLCISVNDVVVHGIPSGYMLKHGDIVSVDCGVVMNGFNGDSCYTFEVGEVSPEVKALLVCTKECLYKGIEQAVSGNSIGDIGYAIQKHAESNGYSVVRELVGHGIGKKLHEDPEVPNYGKPGRGVKLVDRMTIAIEPMINLGKQHIYQEYDGWTIRTKDGKPSAHFEHTVVVRDGKADILSDFGMIEEVLKSKKS
ncbi:MAG TPA: type I methionyl aminopeptidase [Bacteroidales bacterium]|jgi:methionyl aminopeptidase|nr:type I methionyl aminopeptidase [Bacteroidales bacterium]HQB20819.1 type I methionyl aminopeptidase [Bacteroidales bacterium]